MPIKTIIFDFSGVLSEEVTLLLEEKHGFGKLPASQQKLYISAMHKSNVGKIPSSELLKVMRGTLLPQFSTKQIFNMFLGSKPLPPARLLQKLRNNYQVLIFSNHEKTWPKQIMKRQGIDVTGIPFINSSRVGMRKPHMNFYRYMIQKYKVIPEQAVFIDDRPVNLVPAKKLGIHTFWYHNNYSELLVYLKKLGIKGL